MRCTVPALPGFTTINDGELTAAALRIALGLGIFARTVGPVPMGVFLDAIEIEVRGPNCSGPVPGSHRHDRLVNGAVRLALVLGLLEMRDGYIGPSRTMLRTIPWWEARIGGDVVLEPAPEVHA